MSKQAVRIRNNSAGAGGKFTVAGRKALVVGLAATGVSSARFLKKHGADVAATDVKPITQLPEARALMEMGIRIEAGGHTLKSVEGVDLVVVSPGVRTDSAILNEARRRGIEVMSDIELAYRFIDSPVLAIAGTNGKTTTTALLGKVLADAHKKVFVGGNIGTPAIEYAESGETFDYCVLEISSFHLETTRTFNPHVGVLLNITEDHLDRYRDFEDYAQTKFRLFENQGEGDFAVVNVNDPVIRERVDAGLTKGRVVPFTVSGTLKEGLVLKGDSIIYKNGGVEEIYPTKGFKLTGLHNMENIMAVIASARAVGAPQEIILGTLEKFKGLSHRMEFVRELDGVVYIDDSKGTNIGALMMALKGIEGPVVLIAGGRDKGGDYSVLSGLIKDRVKLLILLGEARHRINEALGSLTETVVVDSFEEAVKKARLTASVGDTVLLCPSCSSFDMFRDYKERGERFKTLVEALR